MVQSKLHKELVLLGEQLTRTLKAIMSSTLGINQKVGENTLIDSNLYDSVTYNVHSDIVDIIVNDYIVYINGGRRPGSWVPIRAIRDWAFRKGLPTDNGFVYAVQRAIYNDGIKARPILDSFERQIDMVFSDWADHVFVELTNETRKALWPD